MFLPYLYGTIFDYAMNSNSKLYSSFFDIQKAYDCVWCWHILSTLQKLKFSSNMIFYLKDFSADRQISIRISSSFSPTFLVENKVSQDSVLSVPFFSNQLYRFHSSPSSCLPCFYWRFQILLLDNPERAHCILQHSLDQIYNWTNQCGFHFSHSKKYLL